MSEVTRRLTDAMLEYARKNHDDGACVALVYVADDLARVAIEAMREPSEAMLIAALNNMEDQQADRETILPIEVWRAMIDAALKPETPNE